MRKIKNIIFYINIIRFLPHLSLYVFSKNRCLINEDLEAYKKEYELIASNWYALNHFLFYHLSFRALFYYRIGEAKWLIHFLAPGIQNLSFSKSTIGGGLILYHAYGTI